MGFAKFKEEFKGAQDRNEEVPGGIYSTRVQNSIAGTKFNKLVWSYNLLITGPGMNGRLLTISRYPEQQGGLDLIKTDLCVMSGKRNKPLLPVEQLDIPDSHRRIVGLQLEVFVSYKDDPKEPGKKWQNINLRRLIDKPLPPDVIRFPFKSDEVEGDDQGHPENGNGANGVGANAEYADDTDVPDGAYYEEEAVEEEEEGAVVEGEGTPF